MVLVGILWTLVRIVVGLTGLVLLLGALNGLRDARMVRGTLVARERMKMSTVALALGIAMLVWACS